ncbi:MAG TPA: polysaccharide deacetylase family protein [Mycobacteriales bacterium]|nr:polysaccharide deacetylase family protein [Mycobacteriales bacterium]
MRGVRTARWAVVVLVVGGCVGSTAAARPTPTIEVGGRLVPVSGSLTVADALRLAGVVVPSGHVLSAGTGRPLPGDHQPGQVLVDGAPAATDTAVRPGAVLTVVPGRDVTEPLKVVSEPVRAGGGMASLRVGGRDGRARVVKGAISGETVSRRVLAPPSEGLVPRAVALTFDDGPDPRWTPQVLGMLAAAHVHATFCLVGRHAAAHPELVRAIVSGGHQLCNHTWSHDEDVAKRAPAVMRAELARTQRAIRAACGVTPRLFRAPGGRWSAALAAEARRQGMSALHWQVDPRDWTRPGAARIVHTSLAQVRPGAIVLLHDGGGIRTDTLFALPVLLKRLHNKHYAVALPHP